MDIEQETRVNLRFILYEVLDPTDELSAGLRQINCQPEHKVSISEKKKLGIKELGLAAIW